MCQEVYNRNTDQQIDTIGQLRAVIGADNILPHCSYDRDIAEFPDETCLCPVDVQLSAEKAGYEFGYDQGIYHIWKTD